MTISALIVAWVLSIFGVDELFIKAMDELFNKQVTSASYYFMFLLVGLSLDVIQGVRG